MLEFMFICMIITIIASIAFRIYLSLNKTERSASDVTSEEVFTIENAMKFYKLDNGFYPTNSQGIPALVVKPVTNPIPQHWVQYLQKIPLDKKGNPYHYAIPGKHKEFDIYGD